MTSIPKNISEKYCKSGGNAVEISPPFPQTPPPPTITNTKQQNRPKNMSSSSNSNGNNHRINNGTQACAACKYQRRKCAPDCALAPYFPHDRQRQFLNAHKLFGVSNITKIIRNLSPPDKDIAMRTIIYQSDARAKDPVGGCYRIIRELHHQIEYCKAELDLVLQQLALCKAQAYQSQLLQMSGSNQGNGEVIQTPSTDPPTATISSCNNSSNNNNEHGHDQIVADTNYNQEYQALMRCYYDEDQVGNEQEYVPIQVVQGHPEDEPPPAYTWTVQDDAVLASSNGSVDNNEYYMIKPDFRDGDGGDQCSLLEVKPQMGIENAPGAMDPYDDGKGFGISCKFDDNAQVDVSSCDLQREDLKLDAQQTTQLSEEIILNEGQVILEEPHDKSFHHHHHRHHHIPDHDLRNAATLFTLTN